MIQPFELQYSAALCRAFEAALHNAGHESYKYHRVGLDLDEADEDDLDLSLTLIEEEYHEFMNAVEFEPKEQVLKELCDLLVVLLRFAVHYDLPLNKAFERVYENNMAKAKGLRVREDGKVLKPEGHPKVKLDDLF